MIVGKRPRPVGKGVPAAHEDVDDLIAPQFGYLICGMHDDQDLRLGIERCARSQQHERCEPQARRHCARASRGHGPYPPPSNPPRISISLPRVSCAFTT